MITRRSAFDAPIQNKTGVGGGGAAGESTARRVVAKSVAKRQSLSPTKRYSFSISASKSLVIMILSCSGSRGIQYRLVRETEEPRNSFRIFFSVRGIFVVVVIVAPSKSLLRFYSNVSFAVWNVFEWKLFYVLNRGRTFILQTIL